MGWELSRDWKPCILVAATFSALCNSAVGSDTRECRLQPWPRNGSQQKQSGLKGTGERMRHVVKNRMQTGWGRGRGQANADTQEKYRQSITMILKNRKCGKEGYWDFQISETSGSRRWKHLACHPAAGVWSEVTVRVTAIKQASWTTDLRQLFPWKLFDNDFVCCIYC